MTPASDYAYTPLKFRVYVYDMVQYNKPDWLIDWYYFKNVQLAELIGGHAAFSRYFLR